MLSEESDNAGDEAKNTPVDGAQEEEIDLDAVAAAVAEVVSHNTGDEDTPVEVIVEMNDAAPATVNTTKVVDDIIILADSESDAEIVEVINDTPAVVVALESDIAALESEKEQLQAQLDAAQSELEGVVRERDENKNRLLRVAADLENVRKRKEREKDELRKFGAVKVVLDLLPAVDNLERALDHSSKEDGADSTIADGIKMVHRQIISALEKHHVKGFASLLERFDPQRHEAIQQIETSEHETGVVLQEFQKGYFLHERLIRPSLVVVSKYVAPPEPTESEAADVIDIPGPSEEDSEPLLEEITPEDSTSSEPNDNPVDETVEVVADAEDESSRA